MRFYYKHQTFIKIIPLFSPTYNLIVLFKSDYIA